MSTHANKAADKLSCVSMQDNITINPAVITYLQVSFGTINIDRFATAANKVVPHFNSYFYEPGCSGTDAFAQKDWGEGINFVNPPLS